ncbi:MAG: hypothetical protein AAFY65_03405 [Pseudomonadota bacterium]
MKRRDVLLGLGALLVAAPKSAMAAVREQVVAQLRAQGYRDIRVTRTFLGRLRIVARNGRHTREIILNPATGEILRDYWPDDRDTRDRILHQNDDDSGGAGSGSTGGSGGGGGPSGDEDDDDDDDEDEGGDDEDD